MARVHEVHVKGGEKRGQPQYGSRTWEVTALASIEPGDVSLALAVAAIKKDVVEALDLCWAEASVKPTTLADVANPATARHRLSIAQRRRIEELVSFAQKHLKTRPTVAVLNQAEASLESLLKLTVEKPVQFADEADDRIKALRSALFDVGVKS